MTGVQSPRSSAFLAQRPAGCARSIKPGADLHRPWTLPLPRRATRKGQLRLSERNVLADFQADAPGAPLGRVSFVMRMTGNANDPIEQILAPACEVILQNLVA